jgi:hypothetical protein
VPAHPFTAATFKLDCQYLMQPPKKSEEIMPKGNNNRVRSAFQVACKVLAGTDKWGGQELVRTWVQACSK